MSHDSSRTGSPADRAVTRPGVPATVVAAAAALSGDVARTSAARRLRPVQALPGLERLAGLAAQLLRTSSAQISLLTEVEAVAGGVGPEAGRAGDEGALEDALCSLTAATGAPLSIADTRADPRVAQLGPVASGALGSYLGVPLTGGGGQVVGAVCVGSGVARPWSEQDVALLRQIAAAAVVELELSALAGEHRTSEALLDLSVTAAGIGTFDVDLAGGTLRVNDELLRLSGLDRATFGGDPQELYATMHPDDVESTLAAVRAAVGGGEYRAEYRVVAPDGSHRWLAARGRTLPGPDGAPARLLGAVHDVTALRQAAQRVEDILDAMAVGYLAVDERWRITYVNTAAELISSYPREQLLGRVFWEQFPATLGTVFEEHYRRAVVTGRTAVFDAYYPEPVNAWLEVRVIPEGGGLGSYFLDVTARVEAQQAADAARQLAESARRAGEAANARLRLLSEVSRELSATLDAEQAVQRLAQLVVPALGDWCVITLVEDDAPAGTPAGARRGRAGDLRRGLRDVGCWHREEAARPTLAAYAACRIAELTDDAFLLRALRAAHPVHVEDATAAITAVLRPGGRAARLLAELAPTSAVVLPLRGRDRTVGLLTLFAAAPRAALDPEEAAVAAEVAARAGLALDAARLYRLQRDLAEGLQRSLLSEPPEPDHGQIVVRYTPAAEAAQVGGDWYDAFLQPSGATVLVIGDVIGHDTQAAAAMSQVRTILRAFGSIEDDPPAQVLARTDRAMANLQLTTTATAIVARLEQDPDERARGVTRLRWSNAGHPPAMVVNPDGTVFPLMGLHADLLLGVLPDLPRSESQVVLDRGSTVVLYTDGLVERRDQSLQVGLERLQDTLADLAGHDLPLDDLVDGVLRRLLPPQPEDDVAVVAVRLHRQDRPRPAEAGPRRVPPHVPAEPGGG